MEKWDIPQFKFKSLPRNAVRDEWLKYKRHFGYIISATNETDRTRIRNILLAKGGPDLQEVFASIPGADVSEDADKTIDPYAVAIEKLDSYFSPKQHDTFERNRFWLLKPNAEETLEKFMLRCQDQANKCDFGKSAEESRSISVVDKVILFAPSELKEQLLQRDTLSLDDVTKIVTTYESVKQQARSMSIPTSSDSFSMAYESSSNINSVRQTNNKECTRCGRKGHFGNDASCPAKGKECNKCRRIGHFATQCRTAFPSKRKYEGPGLGPGSTHGGKRFRPERVREIDIQPRENYKDSASSSKNFIFRISDGDELLWLKVGGVLLQVLVDSGCRKNIIDEKSWEYLKANCAEVWNQQKECDEVFLPYGDQAKPLTVLGKFFCKSTLLIIDLFSKLSRFYTEPSLLVWNLFLNSCFILS